MRWVTRKEAYGDRIGLRSNSSLDKEDHYLSRSATRLQMLQSSIAFLQKHNPPD